MRKTATATTCNTAADEKVRESHAALNGTTLPIDDPFWNSYLPPLGWNCRCTTVQVLKDKYPASNSQEAIDSGNRATAAPKQQIFRFNPGKTMKVFPPKHPHLPKGCGNCPLSDVQLAQANPSWNCAACAKFLKCIGDPAKSQMAVERIHYLKEMEPLLKKRLIANGNGHDMSVGFSIKGNKRLYSDTFGRSNALKKDDLKAMDKLLAEATFVKKSGLSKPRKDDIKRFYYYEATLRGKTIYLNVAETDFVRKNGKYFHERFLYSVTDKIK